MAQPYFTESEIRCDVACRSLQNAWHQTVIWYNEALGYNHGIGNPIYLTQIPLLEAINIIVNANRHLDYLRGMMKTLQFVPAKSPQLQALFDEINPYLPYLKDNITGWWSLLHGSLKEILEPEDWQSLRNEGRTNKTLEELTYTPDVIYGPYTD